MAAEKSGARRWIAVLAGVLLGLGGPAAGLAASCDPDNGGITLPPGFCAQVVADDLGSARHIAVRDNGDIYVALLQPSQGGSIVALRDSDGDGDADRTERFGEEGGTGIVVRGDFLYFASPNQVLRYRLKAGELVPSGPTETVVGGFPQQGQHAQKTFAFGGDSFYVAVGAPSNACQEQPRTPGSPGIDPCPQLERQAGIWSFPAEETGLTQGDGKRFATGLRNAIALAWAPVDDQLYAVQHGRDQLHQLWPEHYSTEEGAELPAEEFIRINTGDDFGWPYCYYDHQMKKKVLAPEYGGSGEEVGRCGDFEDPLLAFPGHWAPNGLLFYTGDLFPPRYRGGAFVAFHGSWNRSPLPQRGYKVAFVPFEGGSPSGGWEDFATGFAGRQRIQSPSGALPPHGSGPGQRRIAADFRFETRAIMAGDVHGKGGKDGGVRYAGEARAPESPCGEDLSRYRPVPHRR